VFRDENKNVWWRWLELGGDGWSLRGIACGNGMLDDALCLLIGAMGSIGIIWFKFRIGAEESLQFVYSLFTAEQG
jgi:hypothetical protein